MDIIRDFMVRGIELIPEGDRLRVRGALTESDRELIRERKAEILKSLSQNICLGCRASGYWDYSHYAGKLLCFHYAVFEGRSGKPKPCIEARENCPRLT